MTPAASPAGNQPYRNGAFGAAAAAEGASPEAGGKQAKQGAGDANKRVKRDPCSGSGEPASPHDGHFQPQTTGNSAAAAAARRASISAREKLLLEEQFALVSRPTSDQLQAMADRFDMDKSTVRIWFCNQRQKQKRLNCSAAAAGAASATPGTTNSATTLLQQPAGGGPVVDSSGAAGATGMPGQVSVASACSQQSAAATTTTTTTSSSVDHRPAAPVSSSGSSSIRLDCAISKN